MEYPAKPRISAPQIAATIAAEGPDGADLSELTVYRLRSMPVDHGGLPFSIIMDRRIGAFVSDS
jgi:hypothetical protein